MVAKKEGRVDRMIGLDRLMMAIRLQLRSTNEKDNDQMN